MGILQHIHRLAGQAVKLFAAFQQSRYGTFMRNKYVVTLLVFLLWMLFFDQNNLMERRKSTRDFRQLTEEKDYYLEKIEEDRKRIRELKTNNDNLEKFAREQYLMKKDNEDIFIIVED